MKLQSRQAARPEITRLLLGAGSADMLSQPRARLRSLSERLQMGHLASFWTCQPRPPLHVAARRPESRLRVGLLRCGPVPFGCRFCRGTGQRGDMPCSYCYGRGTRNGPWQG